MLKGTLWFVRRMGEALRRRWRRIFYRCLLREFGSGSSICAGVKITCPENLCIGDDTVVNDGVVLQASPDAAIAIGNRVVISYKAIVLTAGLQISAAGPTKEHRYQPVIIKDGAWIGAGAIVLPGVTVGARSLVAAGAVVTRNVPDDVMVAGVPANPVRILGAQGNSQGP